MKTRRKEGRNKGTRDVRRNERETGEKEGKKEGRKEGRREGRKGGIAEGSVIKEGTRLYPPMRLLLFIALLAGVRGSENVAKENGGASVLDSVTSAAQPNVVLIMIDDFGYENVAANGGESYRTPVLDRLAETGARLEQLHVQPMCTPTRNAIMTGITNKHNYVHFAYLDPSQLTFGNFFQDAGYATGIVGKWQLSSNANIDTDVKHFGFDEHCVWQSTLSKSRYRNPSLMYSNGSDIIRFSNDEYGPYIANDVALDFITRKKNVPFFLYYPMLLTHSPFDPIPESPDYLIPYDPSYQWVSGVKKGPKDELGTLTRFADMVACADMLVGRLVGKLDELNLRDNTFIFVLGDNGNAGGTPTRFKGREVLGGKTTSLVSGTHVPGIANWPGRVVASDTLFGLYEAVDVLPTLCEAANVPIPSDLNIDGRSFFDRLQGKVGNQREALYFWYSKDGGNTAQYEFAQDARFKLYVEGNFFDLVADEREERPIEFANLTGEAKQAFAKLRQTLDNNGDSRLDYFATPRKVCKEENLNGITIEKCGHLDPVSEPPSPAQRKQLEVWMDGENERKKRRYEKKKKKRASANTHPHITM
jgi:arylsulfatase A